MRGPAVSLSRQCKSQEGAIAIVVAVAMVALLLLVALVADLGGLYSHDGSFRPLPTPAPWPALKN